MSGEFEDEYSATIDDDLRKTPDNLRESSDALLNDTIAVLSPAEPICLPETATVHDAVRTMLAYRQAGVLVTSDEGRLVGIFTERDVLTRVVGRDLDAHKTRLGEVMTATRPPLCACTRWLRLVPDPTAEGRVTAPGRAFWQPTGGPAGSAR